MAGNQLKLKIKASSILEVVISMVVIVLVFGIAMMIYSNVLRLSLSGKQLRAQAVLKERLFKLTTASGDTSQTTNTEFRILEKYQADGAVPGLTDIDLTALDQNNVKVAELRQIISLQK